MPSSPSTAWLPSAETQTIPPPGEVVTLTGSQPAEIVVRTERAGALSAAATSTTLNVPRADALPLGPRAATLVT